MVQGRWRNNGFLTGVRYERTDTVSKGYLRSRRLTTTAEQQADPAGSAMRDYGNNWTVLRGEYDDFFPSVHLWRDLTPDLKIRGAWSTSFGRPSMGNARPTISIDEGNQRVTVGNPSLLPQFAKNYDINLEYYFKHAGSLSVGWFHKTISDYIVSNVEVGTVGAGEDNGYDGEYAGFTERTSVNAGQAIAQGWEFSYIQQLNFLPGLLKGLSLNTNYTIINTHGDFGTAGARRENGEVPGFIPRTGNVRLSWRYRKFGASVLYNYTTTHIRSFNAAQPSRNQYMFKREQFNLGMEYDVLPNLKLTVDVSNAFNEPQTYYRGIPDQLETFLMQGPKYTIGVQGRF
jgi:TonB-dependent receptor